MRTAWVDKYTAAIYTRDEDANCRRYQLQPILDYLRWYKTGELHYLPLEERAPLSAPWDETHGVYLPSRVLDLCLSVVEHPSDDIVRQLSLLSWTTPQEVQDYHNKIHAQVDNQIKAQLERERWKSHHLYKTQTKPQLESQSRSLKIPATSALLKHQLVDLICQQQGETPPEPVKCLYSGDLSSVPLTTASIHNFTIPKLRSILKHHNVPPFGEKDQLVIKVFLLRQGKTVAMTSREEGQLKDLIQLTYQTIFNQRYLNVSSHVYRKRTYTLKKFSPHSSHPHPTYSVNLTSNLCFSHC